MTSRKWTQVEKLSAAADAHASARDLGAACTFAEQAARLALEAGGQKDPRVAEYLLRLARLQAQSGDLTAAEPSYNAACSVLNPTEGEATPLKAELLLDYGSLYTKMRLGWRAILLLGHANARFVELFGPDHEGVGRCQSMLALSYENAGMEDEALAAYSEAIRIMSLALGGLHPTVTYIEWCRADLAFWRAMKAGDEASVVRALDAFHVALQHSEDSNGHDSLDVARRRAMLGSYHVVHGQFEEGAHLLSDAIAVLDGAGENVANFCRQLAKARVRLGDPAAALALLRRSIREDPVGHWVAHGSERERMGSLSLVYWNVSQYLDLVLAAAPRDASIIQEACDLILARKALGAELLATQRRAVSRGTDPELASLMTALAEERGKVAELRLTGGDVPAEAMGAIERLEWEIASRIPDMDLDPALRDVTAASIATLLPDDAALIEFVRFTRRETMSVAPDALEDASRDWYIAFVVLGGAHATTHLVDIGPAPDIDRLIRSYRSAVAHTTESDDPAGGRRDLGRADDDAPVEDDGTPLRARLLEPLLPAIATRTRLFIAPDGEIARVPFAALPDGAGGCLIDTFDISYFGVGRDLRRLSRAVASGPAGAPLVLADPDYDATRGALASAPGATNRDSRVEPAPSIGDREQLRQHLTRSGVTFARLPATRAEGTAVARLLGVEPHLGAAAREELLKGARSPAVIHIATHGFFLGEATQVSGAPVDTAEARLTAASQNPLVRSGLALSGANGWLRGELLSQGIDDGIVNGEDIVAMDLTATELVVLSACETGLGDMVAGEGVMGLRRAFAVAGARTLVLSLWKVPDEQTQLLMTHFYEALIAGKGRADALRHAQQLVRSQYPAPYYWAAFICQGDSQPIARIVGRH